MITHDGWIWTGEAWISPTGRVYGHISGGTGVEIAVIAVAVVAAAVGTYATIQSQQAQAAASSAQAEADMQRASTEQAVAEIEARQIRERAAWEAQATRDAAEFESDMAIKNATRDQALALELANLQNASEADRAAFEARTATELATLEAEQALQTGVMESQASRRRASIILSKRRALAAMGGVDLTSGSPLMAEMDAVRQMELEAANITHAAEMGALITTRRGELQAESIKQNQEQGASLLLQKIKIQGRGALDEAADIGVAARYEASLRSIAVETSAAQQSWARLLSGEVRASEATFSANLNKFNASVSRTQQTWTLVKGVTSAAAGGLSAYGATGGTIYGKSLFTSKANLTPSGGGI
jgi:hypothetical protein